MKNFPSQLLQLALLQFRNDDEMSEVLQFM